MERAFFYCFSECDYAFQLKKDFIPLMMEENYKPDGWLGILLGTRLWTDFTNQTLFDEKMKELCGRLDSICKPAEPIICPVLESTLTAGKSIADDPYYGMYGKAVFMFAYVVTSCDNLELRLIASS